MQAYQNEDLDDTVPIHIQMLDSDFQSLARLIVCKTF